MKIALEDQNIDWRYVTHSASNRRSGGPCTFRDTWHRTPYIALPVERCPREDPRTRSSTSVTWPSRWRSCEEWSTIWDRSSLAEFSCTRASSAGVSLCDCIAVILRKREREKEETNRKGKGWGILCKYSFFYFGSSLVKITFEGFKRFVGRGSWIIDPLKSRSFLTFQNFKCWAIFYFIYQILNIVLRIFHLSRRRNILNSRIHSMMKWLSRFH